MGSLALSMIVLVMLMLVRVPALYNMFNVELACIIPLVDEIGAKP